MSRFDLFFVLVDECNEVRRPSVCNAFCASFLHYHAKMAHRTYAFLLLQTVDYRIAEHIVEMHCNNLATGDQEYSRDDILRYLTFARHFKPKVWKKH